MRLRRSLFALLSLGLLTGCATTHTSTMARASPRTLSRSDLEPARITSSASPAPATAPPLTDLERLARADVFFAQFIERADDAPVYRTAVARAMQHRCNIEGAMRAYVADPSALTHQVPAQCAGTRR